MQTDGSGWRSDREWNGRLVLQIGGVVALMLVAAVVTAFVVSRPAPPAPPPPPPPAARPLTALEAAGINFVLDHQRSVATRVAATVTAEGRTISVQLAYTGDMTTGSGTVSAARTRGDALLEQGAVFLRGDQAFWTALGVAGPPPGDPGWAAVPPDFLEGKLFYSPAQWTTALTAGPNARLEGGAYTLGKWSARFNGLNDVVGAADSKGITLTHYAVNGVEADVTPADPNEVAGAAASLGADHGPGVPLARDQVGAWAFGPAAPPSGHR